MDSSEIEGTKRRECDYYRVVHVSLNRTQRGMKLKIQQQYLLSVIAIGLTSTMILSGCSSANQSASSGKINSTNVAATKNGSVENASVNNNQSSKANPLFNTNITLPNGQTVTSNISAGAVRWKDIEVRLEIQSIPSHSPKYPEIVGNHSTILSHTNVSTSAGTATLVLNERTPPAAAKSTTPTYEYWVIVYKNQYAYCIVATVIGNRNNAKNEVMELLNNWKVPHITAPNSAQPGYSGPRELNS